MRKREVLTGAALGSTAALVVTPTIEVGVSALAGNAHALEVFGGALVATLFFGISAVTAAVFQNSESLRTAILIAYATKTAVVFAALQSVQLDKSDAMAFGLSIAVSAVVYLIFQTLYIARWRRPYRKWAAKKVRADTGN